MVYKVEKFYYVVHFIFSAGFIQIVQTASGQQIIAAQPTQAGQALQMSQASQLGKFLPFSRRHKLYLCRPRLIELSVIS